MPKRTNLELAEKMFPGDPMVPAIAAEMERNAAAMAYYMVMRSWFRMSQFQTSDRNLTKHVGNPAWAAKGLAWCAKHCIPPPHAFLSYAARVADPNVAHQKAPTRGKIAAAEVLEQAISVVMELAPDPWRVEPPLIPEGKRALFTEELMRRLKAPEDAATERFQRLLKGAEEICVDLWGRW